ncbi:MAG: 23S rRNA (uracil(1939)-C(5))-methyltransferase RlmD [Spirochaetes bacterium]|nr:23S rRNA (uracil(1939)-C(5))-methyltransferase RlmD [Spirochaetota bacterium]
MIIEKLGGEGVGIGHLDGKTIFVPFGVPGDDVVVDILADKKSYARAVIHEIKTPSPDRIAPRCRYFGSCGGCAHQNIAYEKQCHHKHVLLEEIYRHTVAKGVPVAPVRPSAMQFGYRNKMQLQCAPQRKKLIAGFYKRATRDIIEIRNCPLHSDAANALAQDVVRLLNEFRVPAFDTKEKRGVVRDIVIRESTKSKQMLLTLVLFAERFDLTKISKILFKRHSMLAGFYSFYNPYDTEYVFKGGGQMPSGSRHSPLTKVYGDIIDDEIAGIRFSISPLTFFQVNAGQAAAMISFIADIIGTCDTLVDAHAGVGTLSLPLAAKCGQVIAIETNRESTRYAKENALNNRIRNYHVRCGSDHEELAKWADKAGADAIAKTVLLLDPPRAGLSNEMRDFLRSLPFQRIIYVACDPYTQSRDIDAIVTGGFHVEQIVPFDMFPHTFHIETVAVLARN